MQLILSVRNNFTTFTIYIQHLTIYQEKFKRVENELYKIRGECKEPLYAKLVYFVITEM